MASQGGYQQHTHASHDFTGIGYVLECSWPDFYGESTTELEELARAHGIAPLDSTEGINLSKGRTTGYNKTFAYRGQVANLVLFLNRINRKKSKSSVYSIDAVYSYVIQRGEDRFDSIKMIYCSEDMINYLTPKYREIYDKSINELCSEEQYVYDNC